MHTSTIRTNPSNFRGWAVLLLPVASTNRLWPCTSAVFKGSLIIVGLKLTMTKYTNCTVKKQAPGRFFFEHLAGYASQELVSPWKAARWGGRRPR